MNLQLHREPIYSQLISPAIKNPNHEWLARIVASWCVGKSVLPDYLGLEPDTFDALKNSYFSNYPLSELAPSGSKLDFNRMSERQDLIQLLKQHSTPDIAESDWIIGIVVAACLGQDHLWQDLGLWSRSQLTALLQYNFPELAAKNVHDMKWKKFLYKELCDTHGVYVCRVPSCEICVDYLKCYDTEDEDEGQNTVSVMML